MTIEQYKRAKELGEEILYLKEAIEALMDSESKSYLYIHQTYKKDKNGEFVPEVRNYGFNDEDIRAGVLDILIEKRDELQREFEEL